MGKSLREFCAENGRDELLRQWDTEKNGGKTPDDVSSGSSAMAWWRCDKGHSFPMRIAFRTTREQGCPYCAGRRVLAGFNDLAAVAPDVAAEWHPTLNGELRPEMIMAGMYGGSARRGTSGERASTPAQAHSTAAAPSAPETAAAARTHTPAHRPGHNIKNVSFVQHWRGSAQALLGARGGIGHKQVGNCIRICREQLHTDRQEGRRARWAQRHDGACTSIAG